MPSPKQFKDQKKFMEKCMHQTLHKEQKSPDQGVAQCLNQWRDRNKAKKRKMAANVLNNFFGI